MSRELGRVADLPELTTLPLYVLFALEVGDRYLQILGMSCRSRLRPPIALSPEVAHAADPRLQT
jgi:hypothetical protein